MADLQDNTTLKALDNQVDAFIAEIEGRKFTGDESATMKNMLNDVRDKLDRVEIKTAGNDYLLLKWGTLKGWDFPSNPEAVKIFEQYNKLGMSMGAMSQHDTDEQKKLICQLIDLVNGPIQNDWDGNYYTKAEAKEYVLGYGVEDKGTDLVAPDLEPPLPTANPQESV